MGDAIPVLLVILILAPIVIVAAQRNLAEAAGRDRDGTEGSPDDPEAEGCQDSPPATDRRPWQFSLSSLFLLTGVCAAVFSGAAMLAASSGMGVLDVVFHSCCILLLICSPLCVGAAIAGLFAMIGRLSGPAPRKGHRSK